MMMNGAGRGLSQKVMAAALMAVSFAFADDSQYQYMLVEPTVVDTSVVTRSVETSADLVVSRASVPALLRDVGFDSWVKAFERSAPLNAWFYRAEAPGMAIIVR